jgi:hypothetical protein
LKTHPSHIWQPDIPKCALCDCHVLSLDAKWPCRPLPKPDIVPRDDDPHMNGYAAAEAA